MMHCVYEYLYGKGIEAKAIRSQAKLADSDADAVWAGCVTAWMFLLRGGEWLCHDGKGYDLSKVILGSGVRLHDKTGKLTRSFAEAMELSLEIRASKIDQYNTGVWFNHFRSGERICPVEAMHRLFVRHPERFHGGADSLLPLFRLSNGQPLWASQITVLLETAAIEEGLPSARFGTHSMRIGGATALLHAGVPIELIKRMGRWVSDSFQRYLWEAAEGTEGLSKKMASTSATLSVTRQGPVDELGRGRPGRARK